MQFINIFNAVIVICLLIPNVIYALKKKNLENRCGSKVMNILEQAGRYASMFFMVFNIGIYEFGFGSKGAFVIWAISMPVLILLYWIFWVVYFKVPGMVPAMFLALIPAGIFIANGFLMRNWLLAVSGILFLVGHTYVTYCNNVHSKNQ